MRQLISVFVLFAIAPLSLAQTKGSLSGSVRTTDGLGVPQLALTLNGPSGSRTVFTGPEGHFRVADLAPGAYELAVLEPGFRPLTSRVAVGTAEARLEIALLPAPVREHVVVTATRSDAALGTLGVSMSALEGERVREREASSFLDLLREVPGVAVARTGPLGHQGSTFVRGGESHFARVMIDGVPVNEPGGAYNWAGQFPLELERVEVVRGAASSLYGTDALAGVIQLVTRRATAGERPGVTLQSEAGNFEWRRLQGASSGRAGRFDWNGGLAWQSTDNEQPNSAFEQTAGVFTGGAQAGRTAVRLLLRGESSTAGTPGQTAFGRADLDATSDHKELVSSGIVRHVRQRITHELRAGLGVTDQLSLNPVDSGSFVPRFGARVASFPRSDFPNPSGFQNDTQRSSFGYQADAQAGARHLVTLGADLERETGDLGDRQGELLSPERTNLGAYLQDRIAWKRLFLTLGGRVEHNDSFGTRAVPRGAVALRLGPSERSTTLRASAGAGIKEPSFFQSFGVFTFALGNPDLKPERSRTFDAGIDQRLLRDRLRVGATAFHHDYRDQIAYKFPSYENLGKTRGRGIELSLDAAPRPGVLLAAQYTHLDSRILASTSGGLNAVGKPLLRRPKHQGSLWAKAGGRRASVGASLILVGARADSDFAGLGLEEGEGYSRLDLRGRIAIRGGLEAFVVAENVLDREYQEVLGYPALGRAVRAGVRFRSHKEPAP